MPWSKHLIGDPPEEEHDNEEEVTSLQEAYDLVNESWQKADDVLDWLFEEGVKSEGGEYQQVIGQLENAMDHLDKAANLLEKLKG